MELFAIFPVGETQPIWANVTDQADAERVATVAAVNTGNVELLSGADLVVRLGRGCSLVVQPPGPYVPGSHGESDGRGGTTWTVAVPKERSLR